MHFPVIIHIRQYAIHAHWILEALSYFIGFRIYLWLRHRRGDVVTEDTRWSVIAAAAVGAAIGSKVLYWFEDPALTMAHWHDIAFLMGGKTIVGGFIGGWIGVEIAKRFAGVTTATGDLFAIPMALGTAIGRIGCFLEGLPDHTYGSPTSLPWGVDFGDGIPRHPTQLYEIAVLLSIAAVLYGMLDRPHVNGDLFKIFMMVYMAWRFACGFLTPDPRVLFGLQSIQWAALVVVGYYSFYFLRRMNAATSAAPVGAAQ